MAGAPGDVKDERNRWRRPKAWAADLFLPSSRFVGSAVGQDRVRSPTLQPWLSDGPHRATWLAPSGQARPCWPRLPNRRGHGVCDDGGMPLPQALMRVTITFQASVTEQLTLKKAARAAGMSVGNYLRTGRGLPERPAGRLSIEALERESDEAWNALKELGEDPKAYFPPDDSWMDDYGR